MTALIRAPLKQLIKIQSKHLTKKPNKPKNEMESLKPNDQRAKYAILLIWIVLGFEIISMISGFFQYNLLQTALNGGIITMEEANANDKREQVIAILYLIAYFVSAITFILWFRRAYYNLHGRATILSYTEGWAAGSWIVPFINLYRPYKIMKELYEETQEILNKKGITADDKFNMVYLGWWWSLWILNNFMGQFVFRYTMKAKGIEELSNSTVFGIVQNFIGIPLALITIKIISNYASVEPLFYKLDDEEISTQPELPNDEEIHYMPT